VDADTHVIYDSSERIDWIRVYCRPFSSNLRVNTLDNVMDGFSYSQKAKEPKVKKVKPPRRYGPKEQTRLGQEEEVNRTANIYQVISLT
jgi:hypothetical protein